MRTFSNKFNALTTKQKMRAGFAVVLVLLAAVGLQSLWNVATVGSEAERLVGTQQSGAFATMALRTAVLAAIAATQDDDTATQQTAESLRQSHDSVEQLKHAAYDLQSGIARFNVRPESGT